MTGDFTRPLRDTFQHVLNAHKYRLDRTHVTVGVWEDQTVVLEGRHRAVENFAIPGVVARARPGRAPRLYPLELG